MKKKILKFTILSIILLIKYSFSQQINLSIEKPEENQILWAVEEIKGVFKSDIPIEKLKLILNQEENNFTLSPGQKDGYIGIFWTIPSNIPQDSIIQIKFKAETKYQGVDYTEEITKEFTIHHPIINITLNPELFSPLFTSCELSYEFSPSLGQEDILITTQIINSENQVIKTFEENQLKQPDIYTFTWDGKNQENQIVPDGQYKFQIKAIKDTKTAIYTKTFNIDATPPQINYFYPSENSIIDFPDVNIYVHFSDISGINLEQCRLFFDNEDVTTNCWWSENEVYYWTYLTEGIHIIRIILKDTLGNTTDYTWNFEMRDIPQIYYYWPENGATNLPSPLSIYAWYNDWGSGINTSACQFILDDEDRTSEASFGPWDFWYESQISKGYHTATLIIQDNVGNQNQINWQFHIEEIPPEIKNIRVQVSPPNINIRGEIYDISMIDLSSFRFYIDNEDKTGNCWYDHWYFEYNDANLTPGQHIARIIVADFAGNITDFTYQFNIENQPPEIMSIYPENGSLNLPATTIIRVNYTDESGININECKFYLDGNDRTSQAQFTQDTFTYAQIIIKGNHTARIILKDNIGNITDYSWQFHIEEIPPEITNVTPENNSSFYDTIPTISANFQDIDSGIDIQKGVKIIFNGQDRTSLAQITENSITYIPDNLSNGTYTYKIIVKDKADNQSEVQNTFTYISSKQVRYYYDASGNITRIEDATGSTYFYYDLGGRLIKQENPTKQTEITYTYDQNGNRTSLTYKIGNHQRTINYTYDQRNLL
ncbi:MAG: FlgD immunoglobulin-like domain containing protein, partial [Thermoplasmata archaeon]